MIEFIRPISQTDRQQIGTPTATTNGQFCAHFFTVRRSLQFIGSCGEGINGPLPFLVLRSIGSRSSCSDTRGHIHPTSTDTYYLFPWLQLQASLQIIHSVLLHCSHNSLSERFAKLEGFDKEWTCGMYNERAVMVVEHLVRTSREQNSSEIMCTLVVFQAVGPRNYP